MFKKKNWEKIREKLYKKIGQFALIDFTPFDNILGVGVKKIYIYNDRYVIGEKVYNEINVRKFKKFIPVVDVTNGSPYPKHFKKLPPSIYVLGRLSLYELGL